jgi:hypothetical protein
VSVNCLQTSPTPAAGAPFPVSLHQHHANVVCSTNPDCTHGILQTDGQRTQLPAGNPIQKQEQPSCCSHGT